MDFGHSLEQQLTVRQRKKNAGVDTIYTPKQIQNAFIESFELIGGVPRLALWANDPENYATFLKLLVTIAPRAAAAQIEKGAGQILEYRSQVPPSPLNRGVPKEDKEKDEVVIDNDE